MSRRKKTTTTCHSKTDELRDFLHSLVEVNARKLQQDFLLLKPEQRIKYTIELAKFVLPHLKSVDITGGNLNMTVEILPVDLRKKIVDDSDNDGS